MNNKKQVSELSKEEIRVVLESFRDKMDDICRRLIKNSDDKNFVIKSMQEIIVKRLSVPEYQYLYTKCELLESQFKTNRNEMLPCEIDEYIGVLKEIRRFENNMFFIEFDIVY